MARNKKRTLRSELAQCTAKICSYMEVNKIDEARQWAGILEAKLIELNLLVDKPPHPGHNGRST